MMCLMMYKICISRLVACFYVSKKSDVKCTHYTLSIFIPYWLSNTKYKDILITSLLDRCAYNHFRPK